MHYDKETLCTRYILKNLLYKQSLKALLEITVIISSHSNLGVVWTSFMQTPYGSLYKMPFGAFMLCASIYSYHFYYIKCQAHQQEVPPSCCWVQRPLLCEFMLSIVFFLWIFSRIPSSAIYPISTFELNSVANKEDLETKLDKVLETASILLMSRQLRHFMKPIREKCFSL